MQFKCDELPADQHKTALLALRISGELLNLDELFLDFIHEEGEASFPCGQPFIEAHKDILGTFRYAYNPYTKQYERRIYIRSDLTGHELFFTICHECWHYYEHTKGYKASEEGADLFAWKCVDLWRSNRIYQQPQPLLPELKIKENAQ